MLTALPGSVRIFVAVEPVDARGSFDALQGHVRRVRGDPLDGGLYLFVNRRRTLMKILWFDRTGWVVYAKRLERGTFELPSVSAGTRQVAIDPGQLAMILEGVPLRAPRRLRYRHDAAVR